MNKLKILILCVSIGIFYSCDTNETNTNEVTETVINYWPMEVGNSWTFIDSSMYSGSWRVDTVTWIITDKVNISEKEYYSVSITNDYPEISSQSRWLYYHDNNNIISAGAITSKDTLIAESILIKDTELIGEKWPYFHIVNSENSGLYVRDTIDMILTSIGELNNEKYGILEYKTFSYNFDVIEDVRKVTFYISNKIGPIRITSQENEETIKKSNLIDFNLE